MSSARKLVTLIFLVALCSVSAKAQYTPAVHANPNPLQLGVSYTFDSFHQVPGSVLNNSGATGSFVYYNDFLGTEAAVTDSFGSNIGQTTNLLFVGGGARVRYPVHHTFEPWAHVLLGYAHLSPQTKFGSESTFGYKLGGGVDYIPNHGRLAFRAQVDMLGTKFYHASQFSPEISIGVVYLFGH
jgi:hypothetical protein